MLIIDPIYGPFIRQDENPQRQVKGSLEKTVIGTTVISNSMHFLGLDMTWHDPQLYEAGRTVQKRNDGRNIGRAQPPPENGLLSFSKRSTRFFAWFPPFYLYETKVDLYLMYLRLNN